MSIYEIKKPKRINSVSVTFFFLAVGFGYAGWALVPMFWPVFQLTGIMRGACNDAFRVYDDEAVVAKLIKDASRTGLRLSKDNFRMSRVPYTQQEQAGKTEGLKTLRIKRGKECVIEMHYEDDYTLPLFNKVVHVPFDRTVRTNLKDIDAGIDCTCVQAGSEER